MLGANPELSTVTRLHGERAPILLLPPALQKPLLFRAGPGGMMVSVKVCEKVPLKALTVTVPAVVPAVTVILAWPLASVRAESAERVALPLTRKLTGTFDSGWPLVPMTCTTSGAPKLCPDWVVCRSPETVVMDATRTTVDRSE